MSKITREQIRTLMMRGNVSIDNDATDIMKLLNQREAELQAQYGYLVEGVGKYISLNKSIIPNYLNDAYKPFLPPPSPVDRLDALAIRVQNIRISNEIHAIAAELREGEK